jgi:hypothetical protein
VGLIASAPSPPWRAASGKSVQEFEAGGPISRPRRIASGRVVFGTVDGKLFCLA